MTILTGQLKHFSELTPSKSEYKNYRDELVSKLTNYLNKERSGYKELTKAQVAIFVNKNPFLAGKKNDGELKALIDTCLENGNFKKFWWVIKSPNSENV